MKILIEQIRQRLTVGTVNENQCSKSPTSVRSTQEKRDTLTKEFFMTKRSISSIAAQSAAKKRAVKSAKKSVSNAVKKSQDSFLDAALHYATDLGLPILPLEPGTKRPASITVNGIYAATTNGDQIQRWEEANPSFNVGLATGTAGLVVIDVDGVLGERTLAALEAKYGKLPDTVEQVTPGKIRDGLHTGKGRHLFFQGIRDLLSMECVAPGIDIRAGGGLIVLAPSAHPDGTGTYAWLPGHSFDDIPVATLTSAWQAFLQNACNSVRSTTDHSGGVESEQLREERELRLAAEAKVVETLERLATLHDRFTAVLEAMLPPHPLTKEVAAA